MRELHKLYVKHACREYLENWPELVKYCGYREDNIPQLQDVNTFLKRKSFFFFFIIIELSIIYRLPHHPNLSHLNV